MELILLERVENLGQMGDVVKVKTGYARNFLLPQKKALRASKDNIAYFESRKSQLEAENIKRRKEAESVAARIEGLAVTIIRSAAEGGHLYGSVTARDIAEAVTEAGMSVAKSQIRINQAFKLLGLFDVRVVLHPEVDVTVTVNIARSSDEAEIQLASGGALIKTPEGEDMIVGEKQIEAAIEEEPEAAIEEEPEEVIEEAPEEPEEAEAEEKIQKAAEA